MTAMNPGLPHRTASSAGRYQPPLPPSPSAKPEPSLINAHTCAHTVDNGTVPLANVNLQPRTSSNALVKSLEDISKDGRSLHEGIEENEVSDSRKAQSVSFAAESHSKDDNGDTAGSVGDSISNHNEVEEAEEEEEDEEEEEKQVVVEPWRTRRYLQEGFSLIAIARLLDDAIKIGQESSNSGGTATDSGSIATPHASQDPDEAAGIGTGGGHDAILARRDQPLTSVGGHYEAFLEQERSRRGGREHHVGHGQGNEDRSGRRAGAAPPRVLFSSALLSSEDPVVRKRKF